MKKIMLTMAFTSMVIAACLAQSTGEIRGKIFAAETQASLPRANVKVIGEPTFIGTSADNDGNFVLKPLSPGKHTIVISYMGYNSDTIIGVAVSPNTITKLKDITLAIEGKWLDDVGITVYQDDVLPIEPINIIRPIDIANTAGNKDINNILKTMTSSIYITEDNEIYFRGARKDNFVYIVDGVKCTDGEAHIASGAIGSMMVYTGGVPAQYGDFTGGCIVIETKDFFTN